MYTSYNYYESGYLMGRDSRLSEDEFPFWEKQAERVLNQYTFSRLVSNFGLITDEVKDCACELAELLYQAVFCSPIPMMENLELLICPSQFSRKRENRRRSKRSFTDIWGTPGSCIRGCEHEPELHSYHHLIQSDSGIRQRR